MSVRATKRLITTKRMLFHIELYEDKKLNEKIIPAMLPVTSVVSSDDLSVLVVMHSHDCAFFVTGWMLYLKRPLKEKTDTATRQSLAPVPLDPIAQPWLISASQNQS